MLTATLIAGVIVIALMALILFQTARSARTPALIPVRTLTRRRRRNRTEAR